MRKIFLSLGAIALLGAGCQPSAPTPTQAPMQPAANTPSATMPIKGAPTPAPVTAKVEIKDNVFSPQQLAIKPGDTVVWTNTGKSNHTVTGVGAVLLWDSGNLAPGQQFKRTFDQPGVYQYHCSIHPGMSGAIIVGEVQPQTR